MSYRARALAKGITITARLLSGVRPQPADQLPYSDPAVYFANHTSHLDAVVLWSVLPVSLRARTRPVAAKDYWTSGPVRRYLAKEVLHTVLVERGGPGGGGERTRGTGAVGEMAAAVRGGSSLILFPEHPPAERRPGRRDRSLPQRHLPSRGGAARYRSGARVPGEPEPHPPQGGIPAGARPGAGAFRRAHPHGLWGVEARVSRACPRVTAQAEGGVLWPSTVNWCG